MTFEFFESHFRAKAVNSGYSEDNIQKCLRYAKPLIDKNLPIIFNTSHLAALVGYDKIYLKRAALFTPYFYRHFEVKKKNGGIRVIYEPLPSLKEIQNWILNELLYNIPVSRFAKAYVPGRSLLDNVKYHKGKKTVLCLDIDNFFPSIKRIYVEKLFLDLGYSSNVSNLLSKLCCNDDSLPQGAITSPYLSNIYLNDFDNKISSFCVANNIRYTRYADDLTFSGDDLNEIEIASFVKENIKKLGLSLNDAKTRVLGQGSRQIVTGIVVNSKVQIPKYERKKIRKEVYYITKYGLADHMTKLGNNRANYLKHLMGKITFGLHINPNDQELIEYRAIISQYLTE